MCIRSRAKVYGLFSKVLPPMARNELGGLPLSKRQGLVPGFMVALPRLDQSPSNASDESFELKTLHYGGTMYPQTAGVRCAAVNWRAAAVPAQRLATARQLDVCCGTDLAVGPRPN